MGNIWVYFGTGDATDPTAANAQERIYAVIDTARTGTWEASDLKAIDSDSTDPSKHFDVNTDTATKHGWYEVMTSMGVKILGDPFVAYGVLYFTTYAPSNSTNLCEKQGDNALWGLGYTSGAGQFSGGADHIALPSGPPANAQFSIDDTTGKGNVYIGTTPYDLAKPQTGGRSNLLYWRDSRVKP
ncbi:MAG: hypothetical protein CVU54_19075 [Deltaproteobacteria bacterium HGW-Deltaproteobacteria-12]|nr:MAG: hypothetical protein CVU54_19075 [Deltaproteobacteria bacterium HGW-Deltaproteobacteria-12]